MYGFEVKPALRGTTYADALQMVDARDGTPRGFAPTDGLTWRLFCNDDWSWRDFRWDYGFTATAFNNTALFVLTRGSGVDVGISGAAGWSLSPAQTAMLCRPEYRMTFDVVRSGVTKRVLDTILQVMD